MICQIHQLSLGLWKYAMLGKFFLIVIMIDYWLITYTRQISKRMAFCNDELNFFNTITSSYVVEDMLFLLDSILILTLFS